MSGTVKVNQIQLGDSSTASNNFVLSIPSTPDGTVKLSRGNVGATTQDVLTVGTDGKVIVEQGFSGNAGLQQAKAYVNFDGTLTGTIPPRSSFNITSVVKTGTGQYVITFTNPMASSDYVCVTGWSRLYVGFSTQEANVFTAIESQTTTTVGIQTTNATPAFADQKYVSLVVYGE